MKKRIDTLRKKVFRHKILAECQQEKAEVIEKENTHAPFRTDLLPKLLETLYKKCTTNIERNVIKKIVNDPLVKSYKLKTRWARYLGLKGRIRNPAAKTKKQKYIADKIEQFFLRDDISRATAGKKETKTLNKTKMQKRLLLDTLKNIHKKFVNDTGLAISYATFIRRKPFYVLSPKLSDRDTCACRKHANMHFKFISLKKAYVLVFYNNLKEAVKATVCDKKSRSCMYSECTVCAEKKINYDYSSTNQDANISWIEWNLKNHEYDKNGVKKVSKRMLKEIKQDSLKNLTEKFETEFKAYKVHLFNITHQYSTYRELKDNLKSNEMILHCDFSENYACKMHQDVQAVHFGGSQHQISLHTSVLYKNNEKAQCFCTFSDSKSHTPEAIWAHLQPILIYIQDNYPAVTCLHIYSDGPSSQYRQKKNFFLFNSVMHHFGLNGTWNYFEASHGKGAADGVGGYIKRLLDRKVLHGIDINTAQDAYTHTKDTCIEVYNIEESEIEEITDNYKEGLNSLIAVPNTMKIHQILTNIDKNIISYPENVSLISEKINHSENIAPASSEEIFGIQSTKKVVERSHPTPKVTILESVKIVMMNINFTKYNYAASANGE
ncbi:unnamed protein product [Diatraea saccharalis]|uniref:Uncharacterized protein n=1 Tax=Diatraea saccharalis TaxID=40085 RepID=A0A9N9R140_9NEOP|nr:unnamed protein product [Diatraea saccharalis]